MRPRGRRIKTQESNNFPHTEAEGFELVMFFQRQTSKDGLICGKETTCRQQNQ